MESIGFVAVFIGILLVTLVVWKTWKPKQPEKYSRKKIKKQKMERKENLILGKELFHVYNYLKKPIRLEVLASDDVGVTTNKPETLVEDIPAGGKAKLNKAQVDYYMRRGHHVKVYVKDVKRPGKIPQEELYSNNVFSLLPKDKTIKNLFIGMVTSRWVQTEAADSSNWVLPNAVQGMPWVKIHNFTDRYIALNNNINISPRGILRYSGSSNFGIPLGTIFKDQSGIHADYKYMTPGTDIYYGVVSDIAQPLSGGWQLDSIFSDDNFESQWGFQTGLIGGPANGNIAVGYLPRDGPPVPKVNEWGEILSKPGELYQGFFPPDDDSLDALPSACAMRIAQG